MERRASNRLPEELRALFVRGLRGAPIESACVRDLGEGGARLSVDGPVPVGVNLYVGFFLRDDPEPLVAMARVVWTRPQGRGHELGLAFEGDGEAQRSAVAMLATYLEARRVTAVLATI